MPRQRDSVRCAAVSIAIVCGAALAEAQTLSAVRGRLFDQSGAVVPGASIGVQNHSTGFDASVRSDSEGRYYVVAIPAGKYSVTVEATGFRAERIETLDVDVGRRLVLDFHLAIAGASETVIVGAEAPLVDRATAVIGHVVKADTVQEIPLSGRHFIDLSLLVPGSVAPSQAGFSSRPIRGVGALAFNTGGNREEAAGFLVNGVSTNNLTFGSLLFEPPLTSVRRRSQVPEKYSFWNLHVAIQDAMCGWTADEEEKANQKAMDEARASNVHSSRPV